MSRPRLDLIDLDQQLTGQRRFISCWLSRGAGPTFIVGPGPVSTAPHLLGRLRELGIDRLDLILLTHVHLDHGGAAAAVLEAFPGARVACHERGARHLTEPSRLWEGSRAVLGAVAEAYGEPGAVPPAALLPLEALEARGILPVRTPGHAPHHVSYLHAGTLYVGEAAGTLLTLPDGAAYLRPATPPAFFPEPALDSLDALLDLAPAPERLAFAHHGLREGESRRLLRAARDEHLLSIQTAREEGGRRSDDFAELLERTRRRLRREDPAYAQLGLLPPDIQERERRFSLQSLRGIFGAIDGQVQGTHEDRARRRRGAGS